MAWSKDSRTTGQVPWCSGLLTWAELTLTTGVLGVECDGDPTSDTGESLSLQSSLGVKNSGSLHYIGKQARALCGNLHSLQGDVQTL